MNCCKPIVPHAQDSAMSKIGIKALEDLVLTLTGDFAMKCYMSV